LIDEETCANKALNERKNKQRNNRLKTNGFDEKREMMIDCFNAMEMSLILSF
jgi:hypothetical protein